MKKKILIALTLIIAILVAAGCAGNTDPVEQNETTESTTEYVVETAAPVAAVSGKREESTFTTEARIDSSSAKIAPLPISFDPENPDNCSLRVSFNSDCIYGSGVNDARVKFTLYAYDTYDMVDIASLKEGDTIIVENEVVTVKSVVEEDYGIVINRSENEDGICFVPTDSGVYYVDTNSALKNYYAVGQVTLPISPEFVFTDYFKDHETPVVLTVNQIVNESPEIDYWFVPDNSTIVVENGMVISLTRNYLP